MTEIRRAGRPALEGHPTPIRTLRLLPEEVCAKTGASIAFITNLIASGELETSSLAAAGLSPPPPSSGCSANNHTSDPALESGVAVFLCVGLRRFGMHDEPRGNAIEQYLSPFAPEIKPVPQGRVYRTLDEVPRGVYSTYLADPPWKFQNRTGKVAPEHRRLARYATMTLAEILALPVAGLAPPIAHLYLWCPNALLPDGLAVMAAWGFTFKTVLVWHKVRIDGGSDGRGVGFYFRNTTELILFGTRGKGARTLAAGRRQTNLIATRKREHSRKPDELYPIIESCSPGPEDRTFCAL